MPAILTFLTSKLGIAGAIGLALLLIFGVQEARLKLAQHAEQSARADAKTASDGWATCRASLATQDAALKVQSDRSTEALAAAGKAAAAAAPRAAHYAAQGSALASFTAKGADRCERLEDAVAEARKSFQ